MMNPPRERIKVGYSPVHSQDDDVSVHCLREPSSLLDPGNCGSCNGATATGRYSYVFCHGTRRAALCACLSVLLLLLLLLLFASHGEPVYYISHRFRLVPPAQVCDSQQLDPLMRIKQRSNLEGLKHGAVASDHELCSEIGKSMLALHGGNAVDAAIATALCLGVANPASSGIGGGTFILIHSDRKHHQNRWNAIADSTDATLRRPDFVDSRNTTSPDDYYFNNKKYDKMTEIIDAREVASERASRDMFLDPHLVPTASLNGGLAVAVLGELRGLELAHARHGSLDWSVLLEPSARLARDGVLVTSHLAKDIAHQKNRIEKFGLTGLGKLLSKDGIGLTALKEGDMLKNPSLADTLEAVMEHGADALYNGERAKRLAADIQAAGGIVTENDLHEYKATLRLPLISEASGFSFVSVPPPSSGGATVIGILRFLSGFASPMAFAPDTLSMHRLVEAMRHAFAIRMSLSDPNFFTNTTRDASNDLVSGNYMEELRRLHRDNETAPLSRYGGVKWAQLKDEEGKANASDAHEGDRLRRLRNSGRKLYRKFGYLEDHGTTHLSVIDSHGNAVSLTSTVNTYFGSGIVSESTGIVLNNQMDDFGTPGKANFFGLKPSEANYIEPRKKPLSSMAPTLIFKKNEDVGGSSLGDLFMAIGASGGPKIITSVVQVIVNHAFLGMSLFDAMSHPRIHDQILYHGSDVTCFESCDLQDSGVHIEVSNRTRNALIRRNHELLGVDYGGVVQAVAVDIETQTLTTVSDIRKGGAPAGF